MPRARNPDCEKAEKLFVESGGMLNLKDIAEQFNVSEGTVRSWKNRYKWEQKCNATLQTNDNNDCNVANKRGAKRNNQNAVGHGAPKGNKNNYKHGIYEKMLFTFLSEEQQGFFLQHEIDEIEECKSMIKFCDLQIFKFMEKIKELEQKAGGLVVSGVSKTKSKLEGTQRDMASDYTEEKVMTNTVAVHELILKYNNEIEKAKKQKMKCLEMLKKYKETQKQEQTEGSSTEMADMIIEAYKQRMEENKK